MWSYYIYLPAYIFLTIVQGVSEYLFLYSIQHEKKDFRDKLVIIILVTNGTKLVLTSVLFVISFRFAKQLEETLRVAARQFSDADPHIIRVKLIQKFVKRLAIVFMIG